MILGSCAMIVIPDGKCRVIDPVEQRVGEYSELTKKCLGEVSPDDSDGERRYDGESERRGHRRKLARGAGS